MQLDTPYRLLDLDVSGSPLLDYDFVNFDWRPPKQNDYSYGFRETFDFLLMLKGEVHQPSHPVSHLALVEINKLEQHLNATAKLAVLNLLKPGCKIYEHIDPGEFFQTHHRVHLPLVTNPLAMMTIDGHVFHMSRGVWCEIDNKRPHSVANDSSSESRIHMVVDLMPNK